MKVQDRKTTLAQSARALKLAGITLIVISLLNYVLLLVPLNLGEVTWWLRFTTQIVEQGIVPLLGIGLIFGGIGFETVIGSAKESDKWVKSTKTLAFRFSAVLAVIFALVVPIHALTAVAANKQAIQEIDDKVAAQLEQVEVQLQQQKKLYAKLLESSTEPTVAIEDLVGDEPLTEEQLARLQEFRDNPQALDRQIQALRSSVVEQLQDRSKQAKEQSKLGVWKSIARLGFSSLLLAGCYFNIARIGSKGSKRPKVKRRPPPSASADETFTP
ncbi:MAG: HpsJ family protein [Cyanobacteria bacterium SID2]|nr:HpsJ family protein [Cyanobacteria bacterium SID2]MBP0005668.1 HpsJ family protein [Cyanobacteria bacterium SBC]